MRRRDFDPRKIPARTPVPLADWPATDQAAWHAAIDMADVFSRGGAAANWSQHTRDARIRGYGRFLRFLEASGRVEQNTWSATRIEPLHVRDYLAWLPTDLAPITRRNLLENLAAMVKALAPNSEWDWLWRIALQLRRQVQCTGKPMPKDLTPTLVNAGFAEMDAAEAESGQPASKRALSYRNGLMLSLIAMRPLRRRNFVALRIGIHLLRQAEGYRIQLAGVETKTGRSFEAPLPVEFTDRIERYFSYWRPILLSGYCHDRLWVSYNGTPLTYSGLHYPLNQVTQQRLGYSLHPHAFRHVAATSVATNDPKHVRSIMPLLGHRSLRTGEAHYNLAGSLEVSRVYNACVDALRDEQRATARRRRRA